METNSIFKSYKDLFCNGLDNIKSLNKFIEIY